MTDFKQCFECGSGNVTEYAEDQYEDGCLVCDDCGMLIPQWHG
ncbi:hypothetical protein [Halocatena pleomorpha]|nr:hypothetical protein [Halocatena pleomorpha]